MAESKRRILFVDRDGTLIEEPADQQVDRLDKVRFMPQVIASLQQLQAAGYELVIVSNQDGMGTDSFPTEDFEGPQRLMREVFASQGVTFAAEHFDPHFDEDGSPDRKPGIGMVLEYLKSGQLDLNDSWVIGDRETDLQLAANMGIPGLRIGADGLDWPAITRHILGRERQAEVQRETRETRIRVDVNLDQEGPQRIRTGIGFFDHMLEQLGLHGGFALEIEASGDLEVDEHHTVEDVALALGQALSQALGSRRGIGRYGFVLPMDESCSLVAVDLSGRPAYVQEGRLTRDQVGGLSGEMVRHFFQSLSQSLGAAIHIRVTGDNAHHMVESMFKGTGRALRPALARDGVALPSSKGVLA